MTIPLNSNSRIWRLACAVAFLFALAQTGWTQQDIEYSQNGQSVVNPTTQQQGPGNAGGFLPPNTSPRTSTPFADGGMTDVVPKNGSPSQIQNYLKPLPESVFDQTTNGNASDEEKAIDETARRLELIVENYENGKPKIRRYVTQDEKGNYYNQGKWQLLGRQQEITAEGEFDRGRMTGQWKRLHAKSEGGMFAAAPFSNFEGPYRSYAEFRNGKLDGVWKITDRFDQVIFEMPYRDGIRNGTASWFHTNSEKMLEISFKKGIIDGMLFEWNEQQEIVRQDEYIKGRKVVKDTQFFAKDKPLSQNFYLDGELIVDGDDDWWKAQPASYQTVGERVQHGPTGTWYENGQPQMRGQFDEGLRQGLFVGWHPNGQKDVVGRFDKDIRVGKWTWWHANGFKSVEGAFEDGFQVGEWRWWNEDGTIKNRRDMSQERSVVETNDREESNEPDDAIIDPNATEVDPQRDQPEEIESQELPEKKKDASTEAESDIPLDVIPLKQNEAEDVDGIIESATDMKTTDSGTILEPQEVDGLPEDALDPRAGNSSNPPEPITDPFGDRNSG
jgi:antitoxin component YwqK of YwqJK toxin-antitoxin module